jgi:putative DNA-invertase from lambdoid prophage Rac
MGKGHGRYPGQLVIGDGFPRSAELGKNLGAARRRDIDTVVVWRLDRWGRSLADLVNTLQELQQLGVGFISLSEALDFTTPVGRAMAGSCTSIVRVIQ